MILLCLLLLLGAGAGLWWLLPDRDAVKILEPRDIGTAERPAPTDRAQEGQQPDFNHWYPRSNLAQSNIVDNWQVPVEQPQSPRRITVSGRVHEHSGVGVARARVMWRVAGSDAEWHPGATADADGRYTIEIATAADSIELSCEATDFTATESHSFLVLEGLQDQATHTDQDLMLWAGTAVRLQRGEIGTISGRVVDVYGRPLEGVPIYLNLLTLSGVIDRSPATKTDADGRFTVFGGRSLMFGGRSLMHGVNDHGAISIGQLSSGEHQRHLEDSPYRPVPDGQKPEGYFVQFEPGVTQEFPGNFIVEVTAGIKLQLISEALPEPWLSQSPLVTLRFRKHNGEVQEFGASLQDTGKIKGWGVPQDAYEFTIAVPGHRESHPMPIVPQSGELWDAGQVRLEPE